MKDANHASLLMQRAHRYPINTTADIRERDRVFIYPAGTHPVVDANEFRLILELLEHDDLMKTALMLLGFEVMRPIEVVRMRWPDIRWDPAQERFSELRHLVYKPRHRSYEDRSSFFFKELRKDVYSDALSGQLVAHYERFGPFPEERSVYGHRPTRGIDIRDRGPLAGKIFPWHHTECITRRWAKIRENVRKKLKRGTINPEYAFLLDQRLEDVSPRSAGQESAARYRITPYSFRRFGMTWHYYMTFNQDMVALSRWAGHENPDTTAGYVVAKEAIGLTSEMIEENISLDDFVFRGAKRQTMIGQFLPHEQVRFIPAGQSTIFEFS